MKDCEGADREKGGGQRTCSSRMFWGEFCDPTTIWRKKTEKIWMRGGVEMGRPAAAPWVITVPLTMVHFSERGGLEEEVETADTTHPRTDDATSC